MRGRRGHVEGGGERRGDPYIMLPFHIRGHYRGPASFRETNKPESTNFSENLLRRGLGEPVLGLNSLVCGVGSGNRPNKEQLTF